MLMDDYAHILISAIERIARTQKDKINAAAAMVKDTIAADGLVYVFGCGHSHVLAEETFYRAGGLACVSPIFYEPLMLHESAVLSSSLEKQERLAEKVLENYSFNNGDMLICASTSGVNAVPVELAWTVRNMGIPVVGIASDEYMSQTPHNTLDMHLQQVCDVCIDNFAPHGDACLRPEGLEVSMTPVSTVTGSYIINSILAQGAELALEAGLKVPVYMSSNVPGGKEYNRSLIERYKARIGCL